MFHGMSESKPMVPPYMPGPKPPSSFLMTSIVLGHMDFPERLRMDRLAVRVSERGRHVVVARQRDVQPPRLSDPGHRAGRVSGPLPFHWISFLSYRGRRCGACNVLDAFLLDDRPVLSFNRMFVRRGS